MDESMHVTFDEGRRGTDNLVDPNEEKFLFQSSTSLDGPGPSSKQVPVQEFVFVLVPLPVFSADNEGDIELDSDMEFDTHLDTSSPVITNDETLVDVTPQVDIEERTSEDIPQTLPQFKFKSSHPPKSILSNPDSGIQTHSSIRSSFFANNAFISQ